MMLAADRIAAIVLAAKPKLRDALYRKYFGVSEEWLRLRPLTLRIDRKGHPMNGETPPKTTEAERFDAAMRRALHRYDRLSGPGARLHDYVPLKTLEREECIYAIRDALAQR
jgi:hypothetical protein